MNHAERITQVIQRANANGTIDQSNSVRILIDVACTLNSGMSVDDINRALQPLCAEVDKKWGKQ